MEVLGVWSGSQRCVMLQMCLEMVMAVALRNRDRLLPIWPNVHEFLAAILAPSQVRQPSVHCHRKPHRALPLPSE